MKLKQILCGIAVSTVFSVFMMGTNVLAAEINEFTGASMETSNGQASSGGTMDSSTTSDVVTDDAQSEVSAPANDTTTNAVIVANWKPVTAEEKAIYALVGCEPIKITTQGTAVDMTNSIQGKQCYAVFKKYAGDYTLARTYNIFPKGSNIAKPVYETANPVTISFKIPAAVRADNRTYQMIGVTKNGIPTVYQDEDKNPDTVTITTNHFYAYALCYKNN